METNNSHLPVSASKDFAVAADVLYQAWTDPEQLKQWWKPMAKQLLEVRNELKEGGEIEYKFQSEGREDLVIRGKYLEVVPTEKLVYTWKWQVADEALHDSEYKLTVQFLPAQRGSRIQISQEDNTSSEAIKPHQHGWDEALDHLSEFLLSKNQSGEQPASSDDHAESSGVPDHGSQDPAGV